MHPRVHARCWGCRSRSGRWWRWLSLDLEHVAISRTCAGRHGPLATAHPLRVARRHPLRSPRGPSRAAHAAPPYRVRCGPENQTRSIPNAKHGACGGGACGFPMSASSPPATLVVKPCLTPLERCVSSRSDNDDAQRPRGTAARSDVRSDVSCLRDCVNGAKYYIIRLRARYARAVKSVYVAGWGTAAGVGLGSGSVAGVAAVWASCGRGSLAMTPRRAVATASLRPALAWIARRAHCSASRASIDAFFSLSKPSSTQSVSSSE